MRSLFTHRFETKRSLFNPEYLPDVYVQQLVLQESLKQKQRKKTVK